jgi:tRNA-splicing ligase RtcB
MSEDSFFGKGAQSQTTFRSFDEECKFIHRETSSRFKINVGFVPNMNVPGYFYVNSHLEQLMFDELKQATVSKGVGSFLPAVKQIANVASLPGIVKGSIGLPDVHSGYGISKQFQAFACIL